MNVPANIPSVAAAAIGADKPAPLPATSDSEFAAAMLDTARPADTGPATTAAGPRQESGARDSRVEQIGPADAAPIFMPYPAVPLPPRNLISMLRTLSGEGASDALANVVPAQHRTDWSADTNGNPLGLEYLSLLLPMVPPMMDAGATPVAAPDGSLPVAARERGVQGSDPDLPSTTLAMRLSLAPVGPAESGGVRMFAALPPGAADGGTAPSSLAVAVPERSAALGVKVSSVQVETHLAPAHIALATIPLPPRAAEGRTDPGSEGETLVSHRPTGDLLVARDRPSAAMPHEAPLRAILLDKDEPEPGQGTMAGPRVTEQVVTAIAAAASPVDGRTNPSAMPAAQRPAPGGVAPSAPTEVVKSLLVMLHPADLGQVDVRLSIRGDTLRVHIRLESADAARLLKSGQAEMTDELSAHGLRVDGLVIDVVHPAKPERQALGEHPLSNSATGSDTSGSGSPDQFRREQARREFSHDQIDVRVEAPTQADGRGSDDARHGKIFV